VVISDASCQPTAAKPLDLRLLQALPAAPRVLELRAGDDALQRAYLQRHPDSQWSVVDLSARAKAAPSLPAGPFELIVLPDLLAWLTDPRALLAALSACLAPQGRLLLSVDNLAGMDMLAQWMDTDLSVDPRQSPAASQPRLLAPAGVIKLLMDAGWMPHLVDHDPEPAPSAPLQAALQALGAALGQPPGGVAERVHGMQRLIFEARPQFAAQPGLDGPSLFQVLVPTTHERQLRVNVEASPGLAEVGARIVSYRGAASPAEALARGQAHLDSDWVLLCHQDVYFPSGFGRQLNAQLAAIAPAQRRKTLIGFVGLGAGQQGQAHAPAGFVIDRLHRVDHPASAMAVSIDELAIVIARDSVHKIDPSLGWHLWATDLCLTAMCEHQVFAQIVRLPLFHNSRTGWSNPPGFAEAGARLARKWAGFGPIHTLCGVIDTLPAPVAATV
jgi:hypothetical protein